MAEVFKAKQFGAEGFDKMLAIKRILPSMAQDSDFISMFIDEAKICGQLHHPNICEIYELGRVEESHFIAMEFVWGKDLLQIQNRFRKLRQQMKPDMAAFVALKMCEGLDHAHKKKGADGKSLNIIHRDISPQNVLVSYDGDVKVIDFGIAKAASRSSKTQAGVLKGKFGYMSPEQVRGLPLDRRSDIFAIGTILYELLAADRLFIGDSDFETLEKVRNVDVPPPSKVNPACPPALEQIIMKALKRDVEDRYQWAADMGADLTTFLMRYEFQASMLAQWMREQFSLELKREGEVLEQQKKITKDAMLQKPAAAAPVHARMGADLPTGGTQMLSDGDLELVDDASANGSAIPDAPLPELPGAATMIVGQNGAPAAPGDMAPQSTQILQAPVPGIHSPSPAPLKSESTMILSDAHAVIQPPTGSAPIRVAPSASTIIEGMAAPVMPQRQTASAPVPMPMPAPASGPIPSVVVAQPSTPHPLTGARPSPPRGSTLVKDIGIGVAVAVALVGAVLGIRLLVKGGGHGKTTLVITANPPHAADVLIDNAKRGHMDEGMPLTLKDLTPGPHTVIVRAADGSEFRQSINLPAGDVAVLPATLKPPSATASNTPPKSAPLPVNPAAKGIGKLQLKISAEGATVSIDGNELADGSWKEPIALRAETPHEIKVTKPAREDVVFQVTLKPGETLDKEIDLLPAYGKIKITSDPVGAECSVNGKRAGVTPLDIGDLDPGKQARVVLRMKGYGTVTKYVSFDKNTQQTVDAKLAPGAEGPPEDSGATKVAEAKPEKGTDKSSKPPKLVAEELKTGGNEPGFLIANTQPWAKVIIDGKDTGKMTPIAPRSKISLKPGKHIITFVADGKKFNFDIVIKPGEDLRLMKQLSDSND
jgi:serine/threonine protein kinase